jgi:hypothetical protein
MDHPDGLGESLELHPPSLDVRQSLDPLGLLAAYAVTERRTTGIIQE